MSIGSPVRAFATWDRGFRVNVAGAQECSLAARLAVSLHIGAHFQGHRVLLLGGILLRAHLVDRLVGRILAVPSEWLPVAPVLN
jgi:hypothetical protein